MSGHNGRCMLERGDGYVCPVDKRSSVMYDCEGQSEDTAKRAFMCRGSLY